MKVGTEILNSDTELLLKLKVVGYKAAFPLQNVLLYAQVEDPDKPGIFESFTCSVVIDPQYFFVQDSNLQMMSYYGDMKLQAGEPGVQDNYLRLNELD